MGNLKNTYTLWVSKDKPHQPIRYETEGFDLLLRGPYDHYYLDYITFNDWSFNYTIMEIPKGMKAFSINLEKLLISVTYLGRNTVVVKSTCKYIKKNH